MSARILIRPPLRSSNGSVALQRALPPSLALRSRRDFIPKQYRLVVNWGNSNAIHQFPCPRILNHPGGVRRAVNKLSAFETLRSADVRVPDFCTDASGVDLDSSIYLARLSITSANGEGIQVLRKGDAIPKAPMYVRYIPKVEEYRVHVFGGVPIHVQQKRKRNGAAQDMDARLIRNYDNGWVFCNVAMDDVSIDLLELAVDAVDGLALDFGALDIIRSKDDGEYYVLECNTAPALESPTTIQAYASAVMKEYTSG